MTLIIIGAVWARIWAPCHASARSARRVYWAYTRAASRPRMHILQHGSRAPAPKSEPCGASRVLMNPLLTRAAPCLCRRAKPLLVTPYCCANERGHAAGAIYVIMLWKSDAAVAAMPADALLPPPLLAAQSILPRRLEAARRCDMPPVRAPRHAIPHHANERPRYAAARWYYTPRTSLRHRCHAPPPLFASRFLIRAANMIYAENFTTHSRYDPFAAIMRH